MLAQARLLFPLHLSRAGLSVRIVLSIIKGFCSSGGIPTAVCELPTNSYVKCMCTTIFSARNPLESLGVPWNPLLFGPGIPAKLSPSPTALCELPTDFYVKCMCTATFSARNHLKSFGIDAHGIPRHIGSCAEACPLVPKSLTWAW